MNGRRLIVIPAVKREDVEKTRTESKEKQKVAADRRNLHLLKEGLLNGNDFFNKVWECL